MKNLKKVLAVMTAAASMCVSGSAFAAKAGSVEVDGITATYAPADNSITITEAPASYANGEATILVLMPGTENSTNISGNDILYINQNTGKITGKIGLKGTIDNLEVGKNYPIKYGYYTEADGFQIAQGYLKIEDDAATGTVKIEFTCGDVTGDGVADETDATNIIGKMVGNGPKFGTSTYAVGEKIYNDIICGDVTGDGVADETDATNIIGKMVGNGPKFGTSAYAVGEKVVIDTPATGSN